MNARLLSLTDLKEYCQRRSGRTTELINVVCDHLLAGNGLLLIVANNRMLGEHIYRGIISESGLIQDYNVGLHNLSIYGKKGAIQIITPDRLIDIFNGSHIKDVLFDTPEIDLFHPDVQKLLSYSERMNSMRYTTMTQTGLHIVI